MTKEEILEEIKDKQYQLNGLICMCLQLGNKDYKNNVLVKDTYKRIKELEQKFKEVQ